MISQENYLDLIPEVQNLFKAAFDREISESFLKWRYLETVAGQNPITFLRENDQLVAHYATTLSKFSYSDSQTLLGGMSGTAMTHPSYQGQGLFQKVALESEADLKEKGFDFLYCFPFPNRSSDSIFLKLGWLPVYEIPTLHLSLSEHNEKSEKYIEFDNAFDRFDYDFYAKRNPLISIPRTKEWLRWRYTKNPINQYKNIIISNGSELRGFAVIKLYRAGEKTYADLVDYFSKDLESFQLLIDQVKTYSLSKNCSGINTWGLRHHFSHQYLTRIGFLHQRPITYFIVKPLKDHLKEKLTSFSNWWIMMGDSDVY